MSGIDVLPDLIWTGSPIAQCLNVYSPEVIAIVSGTGSVSVVKIQKSDLAKVNETTIFFESPCKEYFSFPGGHFIWGYGLRDFQIIDLESGIQHTHVVSNSGNDMIYSTTAIDITDLKIWIDITHHSWKKSDSNDFGVIYNTKENKLIDTVYGYSGKFFSRSNRNCLYENWRFPNSTIWKYGSILNKEFKTNKLTDELSKYALNVLPKAYNTQTNFMIGHCDINDLMTFCTIKWNDKYEDVSIQPLTIQEETNTILWKEFEISPDGKWAKTVARNSSAGIQREDTITFFSINASFPQSLSLPVYGGKSSRNGGGCFLETADWGTVYIDISPDKPGYLIVYKMRDVMAKVVEKMSKLAK